MSGQPNRPLVGIVMGSRSDWETMQHAAQKLETLGSVDDFGIFPSQKRTVNAA